ncbi:MAG: energy transducer TonB [Chitinophaga sp.]|uniref:energy transducer TonB n=1 Tax=Chitinophaga sp. TaxID=1869181 RepID=UPI0025C44A63|nr:energy transducer TonB [Chitinophaga sp.]MBV8254484.1 energy transducer TonB [Chitinophaga sp.]
MADNKSHKDQPVSQELIRQYLAGELDDKAMHALERQALADPFLAEALQGFESAMPDQSANMDDLHTRLATRVAPAKDKIRPLYYRIAAAAAILLLLCTGGWFLLKQPVAHTDHPQVAGIPTIPDSSVSEKATADQTNPPAAPISKEPEKPLIAAASPEKTKKATAKKQVVASEISADKVMDSAEPVTAFAAPVAKENVPPPAGYSIASAPASEVMQKKAKVVVAADTVEAQHFVQGNVARAELGANGSALNEVVVVRRGAINSTSDDDVDVSADNAGPEPVAGYPSFIKYLNDKRMVTDTLMAGNVVRVAFTVLPYGGLDSFRIVKGKNIAANEAAINIIKSGPAWKPAKNGQPQEVKVRIAFRMKKQ